jgi:hypothetical protein
MTLDEKTGSQISPTTAKNLIKAFETKNPGEIISSFIGANHIKAILAQENCIGIRIYNGYDNGKGKICLTVVGVDTNEAELLDDGHIYDDMITCPPTCPINGLYP